MSGAQSHTRVYLTVFAALAVLTIITVAVSYLHLPISQAITLAMIIATIKVGLVVAYFMHLISEKAIIYAVLGVTLLFTVFLMVIPYMELTHRMAHVP